MTGRTLGTLSALCGGALVLCALWIDLPRRGAGGGDPSDSLARDEASDLATLAASPRAPLELAAGREAHVVSGDPVGETRLAAAPGPIEGRLSLDGRAPLEGARVSFRSAGDTREGSTALDREGRFRIDAPPPEELRLTFALPAASPRRLLLPRPVVRAVAGRTTELALDWRTRHVNVRVTGDAGDWNRARVRVLGPDCEADFEVDDDGRAELGLVASGSYRFEAEHPSGRRGSARLELGADEDLESVVIALDEPGGLR
jgi:hypothetical protein